MAPEEPQPTLAEKPTNRLLPLWLMILGSGLTAGVLAAAAGELTYRVLYSEPEYPANVESKPATERSIARGVIRFEVKKSVGTNQAVAAYGLLGLAVGIILGIAGGLAAGSGKANLPAAVVGGILAGIAGAGLALVMVPRYFDSSEATTAPLWLLLAHAAIFGGIGAASGLALGWAWGGRAPIVRCVLGGIIGGVLGTIGVDIANVIGFGMGRIFEPVPAVSGARFVLSIGIALCVALGAALAGRKARAR